MRVFVAGGTGVLGRRIVPALLELGHVVTVLTRRREGATRLGGEIVVGDVLDAARTARVVADARPDVVVHQLTDLAGGSLAANNAVRVTGTRNLVDASRAAGVSRIVVESLAWIYEGGEAPAGEDIPFDTASTDPERRATVDGVIAMETYAREIRDHVFLRNGLLYGPGTFYARDGAMAARARSGQLPATADVASFVHVDDAAAAAVAAIAWPSGVVNIVDDDPVSGRVWVPAFCAAIGAPAPALDDRPRVPWARGARDARARALGWTPSRPSWRTGFTEA